MKLRRKDEAKERKLLLFCAAAGKLVRKLLDTVQPIVEKVVMHTALVAERTIQFIQPVGHAVRIVVQSLLHSSHRFFRRLIKAIRWRFASRSPRELVISGCQLLKKYRHYTLPASACLILFISILAYNSHQFAVLVTSEDETIGVFSDQAEFQQVKSQVESELTDLTGESYRLKTPVYQVVLMRKGDILTDSTALYDEILGTATENLIESYGLFIDGTLVGSVNIESAITDELDAIKAAILMQTQIVWNL